LDCLSAPSDLGVHQPALDVAANSVAQLREVNEHEGLPLLLRVGSRLGVVGGGVYHLVHAHELGQGELHHHLAGAGIRLVGGDGLVGGLSLTQVLPLIGGEAKSA